MKRSKCLLGVLGIFLIHSGGAVAQDDYRCSITRIEQSGSSAGADLEALRQSFIGKQFTVERRTGQMAGILKNSFVTEPQVIDPGSKDNSFKVVTTLRLGQGAGRGSNVYALVINEFVQEESKPFVFLQNDTAYFGHCEHF